MTIEITSAASQLIFVIVGFVFLAIALIAIHSIGRGVFWLRQGLAALAVVALTALSISGHLAARSLWIESTLSDQYNTSTTALAGNIGALSNIAAMTAIIIACCMISCIWRAVDSWWSQRRQAAVLARQQQAATPDLRIASNDR